MFRNLQWSTRKFLQFPLIATSPFHVPALANPVPSKVIPVIRKGFPSTPLITNDLSPGAVVVSVRMIVLSIPAPRTVIAFILAQWPAFHPFVHTAVPAGSCTVSPALAASIASQTASGVKLAAVRVSARTALGSKLFAVTRRQHANNHRSAGVLVLIVSPALH